VNDNLISELILSINKLTCAVESLGNVSSSKNSCEYTFYEWLDLWIEEYKKPNMNSDGLKALKVCIEKYIKSNIPDRFLCDISCLDLQRVLNDISLSRTKKYLYTALNSCFSQAVLNGLIKNNVMKSVGKVVHKYVNGRALTKDEQVYFLDIIKTDNKRFLYYFYFLSDCHESEACNPDWSDIDFIKKIICVRGTKTMNSFRFIPLFPDMEKMLSDYVGCCLFPVSGNVFNCSVSALKCHFRRLKLRYNLTFRIHDFRHTFATRCLEVVINVKTIQKWLGHSRLDTTMNIYSHILSDFEFAELQKFKFKI
jgi:integrase